MVDREDFVTVICDNCGEEFKEQIARLQDGSLFLCPHCKASLEANVAELDAVIRKEVNVDTTYLRLYVAGG
jgi:Zn finger protein HypA/HybF involved in hydrogenase expression